MADEFGDGWQQTHLLPPNVLEARISIGVVAETGHAQVQYEVFNPADKVLVAMESRPHFEPESTLVNATWALHRAIEEVATATGLTLTLQQAKGPLRVAGEPEDPFPD